MSDTKSETVSCKADLDGSIAKWVCDGLHTDTYWIGENATLGIYIKEKLICGVIFNNIRKGIDVWLTIYSENKRWCNRRILRLIFDYVFDNLKSQRASLLVSKDNEASLNLVEKLGFRREGLLRHYGDDGEDRFIYGMLKSECKWRSKYEQGYRKIHRDGKG